MDHNPFVSRNNDLFMMYFGALALSLTHKYILPIELREQLLIVLAFSFLAALFMNTLFQAFEWAALFFLGLLTVSLGPLAIQGIQTGSLDSSLLIPIFLETAQYGLTLLSSWLLGIPVGYLLQKLLMQDYYRQRHLS